MADFSEVLPYWETRLMMKFLFLRQSSLFMSISQNTHLRIIGVVPYKKLISDSCLFELYNSVS